MDAVYSGIDLHSTNSVVAVIDSTGLVEASTKSGKTVGCLVWLFEQAIASRVEQRGHKRGARTGRTGWRARPNRGRRTWRTSSSPRMTRCRRGSWAPKRSPTHSARCRRPCLPRPILTGGPFNLAKAEIPAKLRAARVQGVIHRLDEERDVDIPAARDAVRAGRRIGSAEVDVDHGDQLVHVHLRPSPLQSPTHVEGGTVGVGVAIDVGPQPFSSTATALSPLFATARSR